MKTEKMTGGEAMLRAAVANGIDTIFGLPGAQIYPLFDAMHRMPKLKTVFSRHEQGAAYMAFGYASATGRPGAFSVVPGPGVLNASAALLTAQGCCKPVLCLTGQIPSGFLGKGRGHLHELPDQRATLASFIKSADRIDDPANTSAQINEAFRVMKSNRPGAVAVEMCWDTMAKSWDVAIGPGNDVIDKPVLDEDALADAADLIASSNRIMIMCGSGAQHASAEVRELARTIGAPVTSARCGRGVVGTDTDWGMSAAAADLLWDDTDLLIGIGSRLELQYMRWHQHDVYLDKPLPGEPKLIRIDVDPEEMQRFKPDVGVVGDAADATGALIEKCIARGFTPGDMARVAEAKGQARKNIEEIQPQLAYLDVIREVLPRDGFFVEEVSQMGFAAYYGFDIYEPRTFVTCGYQGTLGFGFPTAIGVKAAMPDRAVISVTGDGGFMFGMPELATAAQHDIGVITIVFNNSAFGNVRRDQIEKFAGNVVGADLENPDFVKLAESFGVSGYRANSPTELKPILAKAIDADKPAVIEVMIERGSEANPWKYLMRT